MSYSLVLWVKIWQIFIPSRLELLKTHHCALIEESHSNYYCKIEHFFLTVGQNRFGNKIPLDFTSLLSICQFWMENPKEKSQNFSKIGAHSKNCWRTSKICWTNSCESGTFFLSVTGYLILKWHLWISSDG